jgi:hypothetical protein
MMHAAEVDLESEATKNRSTAGVMWAPNRWHAVCTTRRSA